MTTNSQLSTTKPKETKSKTNSANNWNRKQSNRNRSHGGLSAGGGKGRMGKKVHGIRNWQEQNRLGKVKNSIGNGEANEPACMTHGHELRGGIAGRNGGTRWKGAKEKKWDNCNSNKS